MMTPNYIYKAVVTNVVDGDTLDIRLDVGFKLTIELRLRLNRVNAFEKNATDPIVRAKAMDATNFVAAAVLNKSVVVQTTKADSFGRYLADVWYVEGEERNLSDELLRLGLAVPYVKK